MNIALVVEHFDSLHLAGRTAQLLADRLMARDHELTVITGSCHNADDWPGIDIAALDDKPSKWPRQLPRFVRFARRQLDQNAFDLSLSMTTTVPADLVLPLYGTLPEQIERVRASRKSAPGRLAHLLSTRLHPRQAYRRRQESRTLRDPRIRRCIGFCSYIHDQLRKHYGMDETRIAIIQPGSAITPPSAGQRQAWRRRIRHAFAIPEDMLVYLMPESHLPIHGFQTLMDAAKRLQEQEVDHMILLAGGVGFRVYRKLASAGLARGFRVVGHTKHMDALYAAADLTVFPTWYAPTGRAVIDSLRMGVPVITTEFCGAAELIAREPGSGQGIVLENPGDGRALAQAMTEMGDIAHMTEPISPCVENLDIDHTIDQLEQIIQGWK